MEAKRNTVLTVTQRANWRELVADNIGKLAPDIVVRQETTKEGALGVIAQDAKTLVGVISERSLTGTVGNEGAEITKAAIEAGVPRAAILSASPEEVQPSEGVEVWLKSDRLGDQLRPFLNL